MGLIDSVKKGVQTVAHTIDAGAKNVEHAVEKGAKTVGHAAQTAATQVKDTFVGVGNTVAQGVKSLNPFKGGGPDKKYDGVYVGAGGQTFSPSTPLGQVPGVEPKGGVRNNETLIYVNGINTSKDAQLNSLQNIADRSGSRVVGVHNATEGMVSDLKQCVMDKLDKGRNPAVDTLADTVYDEIKAGRDVHLLAHSQGGLITSRALSHVAKRLRIEDGMSKADAQKLLSQVKVESFGAAAYRYPDGPEYVHYVNRADPVPDLFGLGVALDKPDPLRHAGKGAKVNHFFEPHLNPIASHSFDTVYLDHRVPFDQARTGDFSRH